MKLPNVNPSAGDTNRLPNTENAPETGNMAAISPLETKDGRVIVPLEWQVNGLQCNDHGIDEYADDDVGE